jgi:hypothetical protein
LPPNAGVFERIEIGKQGIRMVPESMIVPVATLKEKSSMERVLQELDKTDNLPRTERKLSRAVSFAPTAHIEEQENSVLSFSIKHTEQIQLPDGIPLIISLNCFCNSYLKYMSLNF